MSTDIATIICEKQRTMNVIRFCGAERDGPDRRRIQLSLDSRYGLVSMNKEMALELVEAMIKVFPDLFPRARAINMIDCNEEACT